jgi:hypothetical protein
LGFGFEESMDWLDLYPKKSILFSHQKTKGKYSLADCFMCSVGKHFGTLASCFLPSSFYSYEIVVLFCEISNYYMLFLGMLL